MSLIVHCLSGSKKSEENVNNHTLLLKQIENNLGGRECHQTNIDVAKICQQLKKNDNPCKVDTSSDAGR